MQPSKTGVLLDNRDEYEQSKDFDHAEIASGFTPYIWEERPAKSKYFYPYNQKSSLSCVAGGGAIILEHFDGKVVSRKDIYNPRVNYPQGGMMMSDVQKRIRAGVSEEKYVPSQNLGESEMNERYPITNEIIKSRTQNKVGLTFNISNNIDEIASVLATSPVIAFWYFDENGNEWWREYPQVMYDFKTNVDSGVTRHQVCIVDAILIDGKKYLIGQDTAGVGTGFGEDRNLRYISEEMVNKRLYASSYAIDDDNYAIEPEIISKPKYNNTKPLKVGDRGEEVKALQAVLIYEGLLNIKTSTGFFGGLTRASVIKLQEKYASEILRSARLKSGTGYVGTLTNKWLNKKYA